MESLLYLSSTPRPTPENLPGTVGTVVETGWWTLPGAGPPSWGELGLPHPRDAHGALARLLHHSLDPYFWQRHKLLLCTAVNPDIWFPLTAKLTHQLNSHIFYVSSYARFNVFQAQYRAEEFGFTGSGVNCKLFTASTSLTELGGNSCIHLSGSLSREERNESEAAARAGRSPGAGCSLCSTLPGAPVQSVGSFHS